jgi:hypothetical protein
VFGEVQVQFDDVQLAMFYPPLGDWAKIGDASSLVPALTHLCDRPDVERRIRERACACLDLLLPNDAADEFLPYIGSLIRNHLGIHDRSTATNDVCVLLAVYAWARRQPASNRGQLLDLSSKLEADIIELDERYLYLLPETLLAAWAEQCPIAERSTLLFPPGFQGAESSDWIGMISDSIFLDEYDKRTGDLHTRVDELTRAGMSWLTEPHLLHHSNQDGYLHSISDRLTAAIAQLVPYSPSMADSDPQKGWAWFLDQVKTLGYSASATVLGSRENFYLSACRWYAYLLANWPADLWRTLFDRVDEFVAAGQWGVFARLSEIVPPDETDMWRMLIPRFRLDNEPILAFCRWMSASQSEMLYDFAIELHESDFDTAVCAYQAYLYSQNDQFSKLPDFGRPIYDWQRSLVNRRQFAPEVLKPKNVAYGIQAIEADFRLRDPLGVRSY